MATTHEKHEEYSSNVIRVLHPVSQSPNANITNLDSNLDYLLEDLQSSVVPNTYLSPSRDVQYLSPSNSTTIVRERSTSPGTQEKRVYQSALYQYSSTLNDSDGQQNVNQLDSLLHDLKAERDITRERDFSHVSSAGIDSHRELPADINKSSYVIKTTVKDNKPLSKRELIFEAVDEGRIHAKPQSSNASFVKTVETKKTRDLSYEPGNRYDVTLSKKEVIPAHLKTVNLDTNVLPDDLKGVPLSDDILPVPGTKVTTTVRTYTYEIPPEPSSTTTKTLLFKSESNNTENITYPERNLPQTVVFKTESYNTINRQNELGSPPKPQGSTVIVSHKTDSRDINIGAPPVRELYHPSPNVTNIYKEDVTNITNSTHIHPDSTLDESYQIPSRPLQASPTTTYYYKHEASNTKNTIYGPRSESSYPPPEHPNRPEPTFDRKPHSHPGDMEKPTTISYKYSSLSSKSNLQNSPREREPLLQPAPFPTDGVDHSDVNGSPPKRLDELMASFNGNVDGRQNRADETISRRKEVETAVATSEEPKIPSKNVAGPPVYYPPGHEMFARKEESSAAYRAQGGYARASGKYEYEAESKSKSKSRSGAAVVPVCLPLCCAMPCSIM